MYGGRYGQREDTMNQRLRLKHSLFARVGRGLFVWALMIEDYWRVLERGYDDFVEDCNSSESAQCQLVCSIRQET